jgi:mono/diheme cytochrome c family protein
MKATVRHGKAQMPGFSVNTISDDDLDTLVAYIQGLRK